MAVRYDASSRRPGRMVDPLQSVDPWRSQAGDLGPSQTNLDARATATDAWQSYVPLSTATIRTSKVELDTNKVAL